MLSWYNFIKFSVIRLLLVKVARFAGIEKGEISAGVCINRFLCLEAPVWFFPIREMPEAAEELLFSSEILSWNDSVLRDSLQTKFENGGGRPVSSP